MSLNIQKLENVRKLEGGIVQARCPACAEGGHDRAGEHLRVYRDGKFGCCVYPKDREHRKRIFALVGSRERQDIRVKVAGPQAAEVIPGGVLGRLGRVFSGPVEPPAAAAPEVGTLGTGQYIYTCERNSGANYKYKGFGESVPSVPSVEASLESETPVPSVPSGEKLPFLTADGTLSIPFDAPERYHWWKAGQSVAATLAEVKERMKHGVTV